MKIKPSVSLLLIFTVLILAAHPAAYAQTTSSGDESPSAQTSDGSITLNEPVMVTLSGSDPVTLDYEATGGETVSITARSLEAEGEIDPILSVLDADGDIVADNDDHRTSRTDLAPRDSLIDDFTFPDDGNYTIQVTAFEEAEGDVEVLITDDTGGTKNETEAPETSETTDGEDITVEDEVPDDDTFVYEFEASEGEVLTITVRETDGQLDPKVALLDENGELLAENDDHASNDSSLGPYDSQIAGFAVEASGSYTIEITGFGGVGGSFEMTISREGGSSGQNTNPPNTNTGDTEVIEDSIDSFDVFTHTFDAEAGDMYTFTVQAISDDFDPVVSLYLDNNYLIDNDDYGSNDSDMQTTDARIYHYIMPETGEYELDVEGYQDSEGDFRLTIERVATDAPTTPPDELIEVATIDSGETYTYSFDAEEGDYVTISVRGLSYNFDAYVALLDENGTVLFNNDNHGGGSARLAYYDAEIPNYIIEESGTYTIEVSGMTDVDGTFGLTVGILR